MCGENWGIQKPWVSGRQNFSGAKRAVGVISRNEEGEREEGCDPDEKFKKKAKFEKKEELQCFYVPSWLDVGQSWSKQTHSLAARLICSTAKHWVE